MGARQRLNTVAAVGILVGAALIGLVFQSWLAFLVVGVLLTIGALQNGDIRPNSRRR